jgi:excinuclease UvrABC ATPase subunit
MEHMLGTFRANPRWEQAYEQRIKEVTGAVISMQNAATQVQLNAAQRASDDLARLNHPNAGVNVRPGSTRSSSVNTTLGTRDVCDALGRCATVSNDAETIFMDHSGNVRAGRAGGAPPDNSGVWSPTYPPPI